MMIMENVITICGGLIIISYSAVCADKLTDLTDQDVLTYNAAWVKLANYPTIWYYIINTPQYTVNSIISCTFVVTEVKGKWR